MTARSVKSVSSQKVDIRPEPAVLATLPAANLRVVGGWLRLVRAVLGEPRPDIIGDINLLGNHLVEVAMAMPERDPNPLEVVVLRYGLRYGTPMPLHEVATRLGYTRERIRQVEKEVLRRLRYPRFSRPMRSGFFANSGDPGSADFWA